MKYFIAQTFLGDSDTALKRLSDHKGDARFRGVYFLLDNLMPIDKATVLREQLILNAANTKAHSISDTFVQPFQSRATLSAEAPP